MFKRTTVILFALLQMKVNLTMKDPMQTSLYAHNTSKVASVKSSIETTVKIVNKEVFAYTLRRSFADNLLFNVVAVDKKGELVATVEVDLSFEEGADMVEALNRDLKEGKV